MNIAIRAVVRTASFYEKEVIGIRKGFQGLIDGEFMELNARSVRNILNQGGTFLKSARCAEFRSAAGREKAYQQIERAEIDALVVIGGNGSFTGALLLHEEYGLPVIGIPGTIDNDLFGTDYTLGYDSATNVVVECIDKIRDTASSHNASSLWKSWAEIRVSLLFGRQWPPERWMWSYRRRIRPWRT